jgi:hypothetical protein
MTRMLKQVTGKPICVVRREATGAQADGHEPFACDTPARIQLRFNGVQAGLDGHADG